MAGRRSRSQRRAEFLEAAGEMFDNLEEWYDQHPDASFGEIEAEARKRRRVLMGEVLQTLVEGGDSGFQLEPPGCPQCDQPMNFEGYRRWTVRGLEGDAVLKRAYYVCPNCCGETFFPSGQETQAALGPLE